MGCSEKEFNHIENTWTKADSNEAALEWEEGYAKFLKANPHYVTRTQEYQQEMDEALKGIPRDRHEQAQMGLEPVPEDDFEGEFARWKAANAAA